MKIWPYSFDVGKTQFNNWTISKSVDNTNIFTVSGVQYGSTSEVLQVRCQQLFYERISCRYCSNSCNYVFWGYSVNVVSWVMKMQWRCMGSYASP